VAANNVNNSFASVRNIVLQSTFSKPQLLVRINFFDMALDKKHLEELAQFIREHRNNEGHFEALYNRMLTECEAAQASNYENEYADNLREIIEKQAADYNEKKEKGISTWSEFENVINHFEKTITDALHQS